MISPEQLRRFSLFAGIDPALLKDMAMLGEEVTFEAGEQIFTEGEEGDSLYLIVDGSVELKINIDEKGEKQVDISTHVTGEVVGWSALVEPYVYTLNGIAAAKTTLLKLDGMSLRRFMNSNPDMGLKLMAQLAKVMGDRLNEMRIRFASFVD